MRSYITSYTLRSADRVLYTLDLNKQMGFYQISEFVPVDDDNPFIIEQTNRVGTPKIAAFDKDTGSMLGTFKGNNFVDSDESLIFTIESVAQLAEGDAALECAEEDFVAVAAEDRHIMALFCHLPRDSRKHSLFSRIQHSLRQFSNSPKDIYEILIKDTDCCDYRMLCAIAVILHSRGGLQIDAKVTPY